MSEDLQRYRTRMDEALKANAVHELQRLDDCCRAIVDLIPDPGPAHGEAEVTLFRELRRNRRYEQIQMLGEAYIKAGFETPRLWTIYAQALIDRGVQVSALGLLNTLLAKETGKAKAAGRIEDPGEAIETLSQIHGMSGRAWKDIGYEAINANRLRTARNALNESHKSYSSGLELNSKDPMKLSWHGTQRVAVAHFGRMNGLDMPDETALAREIVRTLEAAIGKPDAVPWFLLAVGEMYVALGQLDQARIRYEAALKIPDIDNFMVAGSHRQLSQIWNIGRTEEGAKLEMLLLSAIAARSGNVVLTGGETRQLQRRLAAGAAPIALTAMKEAMRCAESVAMIMRRFEGLGTGFVVDAAALGLAHNGKVVITNAHVVSEPPQRNAALPRDVQVKFEMSGRTFKVKRILASLPVGGHDCSVIELQEAIPESIRALTVADPSDDQTAWVIGHPLGREISFSFLDGRLVGCEPLKIPHPQRLHYRASTEPGNSGSPVFNGSWDVIGIHRAYEPYAPYFTGQAGTHAANEGVSLASIREAFVAMASKNQKQRRKETKQ